MELIFIKKIMEVNSLNIFKHSHLSTWYMNNNKILNTAVVNVQYFES